MKRIRREVIFAATVAMAAASSPAMAQQVVFDPTAAINFAKGLVEVKAQLETAKSQLGEAQKMYASVTGSRGFGDLLRDGNLDQYLPADAKALYDGSGGGAGISGSIDDILRYEQSQQTGTVAEVEARLREREGTAAATEKAVGLRAYEGAQVRLDQIDALLDRTAETEDAKGVAELQVRLAGEQAAIANETAKLQLIANLQAAEEKLITGQKRELSRRILNRTNQGMPSIK